MEQAPSTTAAEAMPETGRRKDSARQWSPIRPQAAFVRAWSCWAVTIGASVATFAFSRSHPALASAGRQGNVGTAVAAVMFIGGFATVGALLAWKRASNPIGWLLSAAGLSYAGGFAALSLADFRQTLALSHWVGWIWLVGLGLTVFVLLLFPTGTLPSRRWRPVAWATAAGLASWVMGNAFAPTVITAGTNLAVRNPIGVGGPAGSLFRLLTVAGAGLILAAGLGSIVSLVFRYRHARTVEREQLKWLAYAAALIVVALASEPFLERLAGPGDAANNLQNGISTGSAALIPIAIGVAIFRYHRCDIELVINRTLVYGSLATLITGVYVAIVVGVGSAAQHQAQPNLGLPLLATAIVAVAFQPVRERVQRLANRLVYGKRATPYEILSEFSARMAGTTAAEDLPRMARILAEGTGAARADVWLKVGDILRDDASWPPGAPPFPSVGATPAGPPAVAGADRTLAVAHQGEMLGALSVSKRPGEPLTPTEDKLLASLAAQAGLVLRNVGLRAELLARLEDIRASRQRLVAAQDEERRRIERNIHDGAQQQLVALAIKLNLTESLIGTDAEGERELLAELRQQAVDAVEELRDLARGIYPPLLAGEGLAAALRAQARKSPLPISVTADGVRRYPQEVEAVAYFCVLEALRNVSKYASASRAQVRLTSAGDDLVFTVMDDGTGFDLGKRTYGTGLQGMIDRLSAIGGTLDVRTSPGADTIVAGRIPAAAALRASPG